MEVLQLFSTKRNVELIRQHLLALDVDNRYRRFCSAVNDNYINNYVDTKVDLSEHICLGAMESTTSLVGFCHMIPFNTKHGIKAVELAISVEQHLQKQGIGRKMFSTAVQHCDMLDIKRMYTVCLISNMAMRKLASGAGMQIVIEDSEAHATKQFSHI